MARITIKDLPKDVKISKKEMRRITGGSAGQAELQDLLLTKELDKAAPKLLLSCCSGSQIDEATLEIRRAGGDTYKTVDGNTITSTR